MDSWDIIVDVQDVNDIYVYVHVDGNGVLVDIHEGAQVVYVIAHNSWADPESSRLLAVMSMLILMLMMMSMLISMFSMLMCIIITMMDELIMKISGSYHKG